MYTILYYIMTRVLLFYFLMKYIFFKPNQIRSLSTNCVFELDGEQYFSQLLSFLFQTLGKNLKIVWTGILIAWTYAHIILKQLCNVLCVFFSPSYHVFDVVKQTIMIIFKPWAVLEKTGWGRGKRQRILRLKCRLIRPVYDVLTRAIIGVPMPYNVIKIAFRVWTTYWTRTTNCVRAHLYRRV